MIIEVVPASGWFATKIASEKRELLKRSGILPISDAFLAYFFSTARYKIAYGGRGSGKSETTARMLIWLCVTLKYFRCVYTRKVADTIRESQFALLKKAIAEMGLANEFLINQSTMAITHLRSGNGFIAKGVDNPEKVKSIDEPSHLWCEEATELSSEDFTTLDKSIRTSKANCQTILTFNPVRDTHWIRAHFFHPDDSHAAHPDFEGDLFLHRSTYNDNEFIDRDAYYKTLLRAAAGNRNRIRVDITGDWGLPENKDPWLYAFDNDKHVKPTLAFYPTFPVYLSFDFNRDPVTCISFQMSPQMGTRDSFIHIYKEFGGKMQLHQLCERIKTAFPASVLFVTGDFSGKKGDVTYNSAHDSAYSLIQAHLNLSKKQVQPNPYNLLHENSRMLMNAMFYNYNNLYISKEGCPELIADCEMAQVDEKSHLPHHLKKDRDQYKMDYFDGMRYFFQRYFQQFADSAYFRLVTQAQQRKAA